MMDDDSDDHLGSRLDSALRAALDVDQVDVGGLVQGSRRRARRIRTQRIAALTATAGLIIGVPVGYEVINPGADGDATSAAMLPSVPARTRAGAPVDQSNPVPTAVPSAVVPSVTGTAATPSNGVPPTAPVTGRSTKVPDGFAFTTAELPGGLLPVAGSGNAGAALVEGQECHRAGDGPSPTAARSWTWSGNQGTGEALSVSLTVTRWAKADAVTVFTAATQATQATQATDATGGCRWEVTQRPRPLSGVTADQTWAATSAADGQHDARALVRVGGGIVGIEVWAANGSATAVTLADRLAGIQASRLWNGDLKSP